jgi:hypothetical protein
MVIIETSVCTRQIQEMLSDDDYRLLQEALVLRPDMGAPIKGSGGLRKIRWKLDGQGKRGGVRIIYYWVTTEEQLWMLYAYQKSRQADLTPAQLATLKEIVKRWDA